MHVGHVVLDGRRPGEVQTQRRVVGRDHRAAGQVEVVGVVDLDAAHRHARHRPHVDDDAARVVLALTPQLLVRQPLALDPEDVVVGAERQRRRLGRPGGRALVAEADDEVVQVRGKRRPAAQAAGCSRAARPSRRGPAPRPAGRAAGAPSRAGRRDRQSTARTVQLLGVRRHRGRHAVDPHRSAPGRPQRSTRRSHRRRAPGIGVDSARSASASCRGAVVRDPVVGAAAPSPAPCPQRRGDLARWSGRPPRPRPVSVRQSCSASATMTVPSANSTSKQGRPVMTSVAATTVVGRPSAPSSWSPTATSPIVVQPVRRGQRGVEGERLADRRPRGDDDHLAGVQAVGELVEVGEAGRDADHLAAAGADRLDLVERALHDRRQRQVVLGGPPVGDVVDLGLGGVDDVVGVAVAGVAELDDPGAGLDQPAQDRRLAHDPRVVAGVGRGGHRLRSACAGTARRRPGRARRASAARPRP